MIRDVVLIDNFDSFTFNLAQYIEAQVGIRLVVIPQDGFEMEALKTFDALVISPGPGLPSTNGHIVDIIRHFSGHMPILGVCLGMQAIYEAFGGQLCQLPVVHHGVSSDIKILDPHDLLFRNITSPCKAGRYHSWICDPEVMPEALIITAVDAEGSYMACRHKTHPTFGVQFHPESILTPEGKKMVSNFLAYQPRI